MSVAVEGPAALRPTGSHELTASGTAARLREACRQFEGVFLTYLVRAMRSTLPNRGAEPIQGSDVYGSMLEEQLAQAWARDGETGIADALYRQLTGRSSTIQTRDR